MTLHLFNYTGLSDIEIRRYNHKKLDFESQSIAENSSINKETKAKKQVEVLHQQPLGMGPLRHYQQQPAWKSTTMGFIPNATTPRAEFMNSFLPEFYKTKFKYSKNPREFVKEFHGKGRELYQSKQIIDDINKQINSMMNNENPASAGAVLHAENLVPSDYIRINNNIVKAEQITAKLNAIEDNIKVLNSKLFSSVGKLKAGDEAVHKVFETQLGQVAILQNKVKEINNQLKEKKDKCSRLFKTTYFKPQSRKRKQKQNKRKARKAKQKRKEVNCKHLITKIAPNHNEEDHIGPMDLYIENICTVSKKQLPYIKYAFDKGIFTTAAQDTIKQYLSFSLSDDSNDDSCDEDSEYNDNEDTNDNSKGDGDDN